MGCHSGYSDRCPRIVGIGESLVLQSRIESVIKKAQRYGFLPSGFDNAQSLVDTVESNLFNCVQYTPQHVLYQLLGLCKGYWL